jgi:hypothetical protein
MGDDGQFSADMFDGFVPPVDPKKPRGKSSTSSQMARKDALTRPGADPNDVRELYELEPLPDDQIQAWLDADD